MAITSRELWALRELTFEIFRSLIRSQARTSQLQKKLSGGRPGAPHGRIVEELCERSFLVGKRMFIAIHGTGREEIRRAIATREDPMNDRDFRRYLKDLQSWNYIRIFSLDDRQQRIDGFQVQPPVEWNRGQQPIGITTEERSLSAAQLTEQLQTVFDFAKEESLARTISTAAVEAAIQRILSAGELPPLATTTNAAAGESSPASGLRRNAAGGSFPSSLSKVRFPLVQEPAIENPNELRCDQCSKSISHSAQIIGTEEGIFCEACSTHVQKQSTSSTPSSRERDVKDVAKGRPKWSNAQDDVWQRMIKLDVLRAKSHEATGSSGGPYAMQTFFRGCVDQVKPEILERVLRNLADAQLSGRTAGEKFCAILAGEPFFITHWKGPRGYTVWGKPEQKRALEVADAAQRCL